jgi:hypothetical protein
MGCWTLNQEAGKKETLSQQFGECFDAGHLGQTTHTLLGKQAPGGGVPAATSA